METDIKRLEACFEHKDYDAMREYIALIVERYNKEQKEVLLNIISLIKCGDYKRIPIILHDFHK